MSLQHVLHGNMKHGCLPATFDLIKDRDNTIFKLDVAKHTKTTEYIGCSKYVLEQASSLLWCRIANRNRTCKAELLFILASIQITAEWRGCSVLGPSLFAIFVALVNTLRYNSAFGAGLAGHQRTWRPNQLSFAFARSIVVGYGTLVCVCVPICRT